MSDIENPTSTDKSSVFDYKQYEANELNYWYLRDEWPFVSQIPIIEFISFILLIVKN